MESLKETIVTGYIDEATSLVETFLKVIYSQTDLDMKVNHNNYKNSEMSEIISDLESIDSALVNLRNMFFTLCWNIASTHKQILTKDRTKFNAEETLILEEYTKLLETNIETFRSTCNANRHLFTENMLKLKFLLSK